MKTSNNETQDDKRHGSAALPAALCIQRSVPLAPLTTFRIGGSARFLVRAQTVAEVRDAISFARTRDLPFFILGGGSNTLVSDGGFRGVVIKMEMRGIEEAQDGDRALLIASAGESWDDLVAHAVERELWGIENLSGIPGTVGAAPVQNIGAYRVEAGDTIAWVEALDTRDDTIRTFANGACRLAYRTSLFKQEANRFIILRVAFTLSTHECRRIEYADMQAYFGENTQPELSEIRDAVLAIRHDKFPDLSQEGTAGSFFLNPIVPAEDAARVAQLVPGLPQFPQKNGTVKLLLAFLLDRGLTLKGHAVGGARLFEHQPIVVVARFGASSRDVYELARMIRIKVRDAYDIDIELEVRSIGDDE